MKKSGMYGEMPEVQIGRITISKMNEDVNDIRLWLKNEVGEGMEVLEPILSELQSLVEGFFHKNF